MTKEAQMKRGAVAELLKDRQALRQTLIHRRNELETKIERVEEQIRKLKGEK